jgi:hypothetical protein
MHLTGKPQRVSGDFKIGSLLPLRSVRLCHRMRRNIILLATFVSILSGGIVAIGLWIVRAAPTPGVSAELHRGGAEHCEDRCDKSSPRETRHMNVLNSSSAPLQ